MAVTFRENRAGVRAMMAAPWMVDAMGSRASVGMQRAVQIAPERTGRYKESFHLEAGVSGGVARAMYFNDARTEPRAGSPRRKTVTRRRGGRVQKVRTRATVIDRFPYGVALEVGTSKMPRQRILGRSIDAMRY